MEKIIIESVALDVKSEKDSLFIPPLNPHYRWHPHTYDVVKDILENKCILATGHAGTGKSSLPQQIAARINQPCVRPVMNGQMSNADFVGYNSVKNGEIVWIDGILTKAMRNGWWIIIDEIDFADPAILSSLNTVTEPVSESNPKRVLVLKENGGEVVTAHPDFRIIATANTVGCMEEFRHLYRGANVLNNAFLDRFRIYHFDYMPVDDEVKILKSMFPKFQEQAIKAFVAVAQLIREAFKNQEVSQTFSFRRLVDWLDQIVRLMLKEAEQGTKSKEIINGIPIKAAECTIFSRVSSEERKIIEGIITRVINMNKGNTK